MALSLVLNRRHQGSAEDSAGFGAIAERFRRAGELDRAVTLCQEGLQKYPHHLSSRVTLGWSLLDLGRYEEARAELEQVLKRAPDNLAAIRGLAQLHDRTEHDDVASMQSATSSDPHALDPHLIDPLAMAADTDSHSLEMHVEAPADQPPVIDPPLVFTPRQATPAGTSATPVDHNEIDQLLEDADLSFTAPALEIGASWSDPADHAEPQRSKEVPEADVTNAVGELGAFASLRDHAEPQRGKEVSGPDKLEESQELLGSLASLREEQPEPQELLSSSASLRESERESDDDQPWCNDGLVLTAPEPEPVAARPTLQLVSSSPASDAFEFVNDEGPGPWPPDPAMIDGVAAQQAEAPKPSHWGPVRDQWPPVELRVSVRCAPPVAPDSPTADSHFATSVAKPHQTGFKAALRRFRRRVDSRRRAVLSEYVAG